ncbi:MAG: HIT family protein [Planctomycetes bacterium]|nr:HIT family protein [Planctomycetota bacterium]
MRTFEDVLRGERPVHRVGEDQRHLAFLSPSPARPGHVIVVTKRVAAYLFDLPPDEHAALWEFCRGQALRMRERLPCERVCVAVIGWQVRHVHVHLVPTDRDGEFPPLPGTPATPEALAALADRLTSAAE